MELHSDEPRMRAARQFEGFDVLVVGGMADEVQVTIHEKRTEKVVDLVLMAEAFVDEEFAVGGG